MPLNNFCGAFSHFQEPKYPYWPWPRECLRSSAGYLEGDSLSFIPDWKPPHFKLDFMTSSGASGSFLILIRGDAGERELYVYEIGFKVLEGSKTVCDSTKTPASLDCTGFLGNNCAEAAKMAAADHWEMVINRGVGTHYGSNYQPLDPAVFLRKKSDYHLKVVSCIEYLLGAGEMRHAESLGSADWRSILKWVSQGKGTTLAKGLEKAGWEGIYYNPDTENPMDKGYKYHTPYFSPNDQPYSYMIAKTERTYYDLRVHDLLINYWPTEKLLDGTVVTKQTTKDSTKISKLKAIPFGFLVARGGEHTAIVLKGEVLEVHWSKGPEEEDLFAKRDFESQWGIPWLSGIIHAPPRVAGNDL